MLLELPKELENALDDSEENYIIPILKNGATDKQKIIYADFIKDWVITNKKTNSFKDKFAEARKRKHNKR